MHLTQKRDHSVTVDIHCVHSVEVVVNIRHSFIQEPKVLRSIYSNEEKIRRRILSAEKRSFCLQRSVLLQRFC